MKKIILPYSLKEGFISEARNVPTIDITENGTYDVKAYEVANVNVEGGGTSDFTTAEVTITNSTNSNLSQSCIAILELMGAQMMASEIPPLDVDASVTVNMVLFKGSQIIYAPENVTIAVTGDITDDNGELTITGAGTITYTAK